MGKVLLCVAMCVLPMAGQDTRTFGAINGRLWRDMTRKEKLSYVTGTDEALRETAVLAPSCVETRTGGVLRAILAEHLTRNEIVDAVDTFYRQPENTLIRVITALSIISDRARRVP
jgi:hypothetical protein